MLAPIEPFRLWSCYEMGAVYEDLFQNRVKHHPHATRVSARDRVPGLATPSVMGTPSPPQLGLST